MKKKYQTPVFYLEEFTPNVAVAGCTRLEADVIKTYEPQTVTCLAKGSDTIFASGQAGCDHGIVLNETGTNYMWIDYTDTDNTPGSGLYFCWIERTSTATQDGINQVNEVLRSKGYSGYTDGSGDNGNFTIGRNEGWHVGRATETLKQLYSHS